MRNLNKKRNSFGIKSRSNNKPVRKTRPYSSIDKNHTFTRATKIKKHIDEVINIFEIGDVINIMSPCQLTPVSINRKNELTTELKLFHSKAILKNNDYNEIGLIIDVFQEKDVMDYLILINENLFITNFGLSKMKLLK